MQEMLHSVVQLPYNVAVGLADEVAFQTEGIMPGRHHGNADVDAGQLYHESPSQMHRSHQQDSDGSIQPLSSHLPYTAASASSLVADQHDHGGEVKQTALAGDGSQSAEQGQAGSPKKSVTILEEANGIGEESKRHEPQPVGGHFAAQSCFDERLSETSSVSRFFA